jgi:3-phenylpropionate/trans-cinnamate dioxygenase ferredoxin subunit
VFNYTELDENALEFLTVARLDDLPVGERLFIEIDGAPIVLFNLAGKIFAIRDVCTHDNGPLGDGVLEQHEIICPRHGARFDITSGKAVRLPAVVDIPAYPVRVVGELIEIGLPKK